MSEASDYSLDPQMALAMERMAKIAEEQGLPPLAPNPSPQEARARMEAERAWWNQDLPEMADMREDYIAGPNGPIRVRLLYLASSARHRSSSIFTAAAGSLARLRPITGRCAISPCRADARLLQ